jgi:tRNA1(Val) A37 N6-methylase TrmN6
MHEPSPGLEDPAFADAVTEDRWLGGRLTLLQPKNGHRVGTDAALLAAGAGTPVGRIADVGAGVGAVGLTLAQRSERAFADLIDIDPDLARLAGINAARNGLSARARVLTLDVLKASERRKGGLADETAECVVTNPPFFDSGAVRVSPDQGRARAHVLPPAEGGGTLELWIRASLALLRPGGRFVMIHRPDALASVLAAIERRLGALVVLPVHAFVGESAHRLLLTGVKGSKAPLRIAPPLVLHEADGRLTTEADAIHRGEALVRWGG